MGMGQISRTEMLQILSEAAFLFAISGTVVGIVGIFALIQFLPPVSTAIVLGPQQQPQLSEIDSSLAVATGGK